MGKKHTPLSKTVKDTIDLVFELTTSNPEGYDINMRELGFNGAAVVKILVDRGILERTRRNVSGVVYRYKWVAASAPTKVLYGSVTQELSDLRKAQKEAYKTKKSDATRVSVSVSAEEPVQEPALETFRDEPVRVVPDISVFSIKELWDEIKRKGGYIKDNRLAVTTYLD